MSSSSVVMIDTSSHAPTIFISHQLKEQKNKCRFLWAPCLIKEGQNWYKCDKSPPDAHLDVYRTKLMPFHLHYAQAPIHQYET